MKTIEVPLKHLEAARKFFNCDRDGTDVRLTKVEYNTITRKNEYQFELVPRVAQHDIDTCCGTTANNVQNLAYVKQLEDKVKFMDSLIEAYQCDTLYQFARHVSMLSVRCEVLTQQVNQLKGN